MSVIDEQHLFGFIEQLIAEFEQFANVAGSARDVIVQDDAVFHPVGTHGNWGKDSDFARVEFEQTAAAALQGEAKGLDHGGVGRGCPKATAELQQEHVGYLARGQDLVSHHQQRPIIAFPFAAVERLGISQWSMLSEAVR
jgi:hypothetical protein